MRLVITGGHHSSALPIINNLREKHPEVEIFWIGHKYAFSDDSHESLEYKDIASLKVPFYNLVAGKFYKSFNIYNLVRLPMGIIYSAKILLKIKPDLILSFGGYLAAPVVISGFFMGIPSITHEQTVTAGYANKLISYFAKKVLVSWKDSIKYFPKSKTIFTGIPLREEIYRINSKEFEFDNKLPVVYVTGGKTGSQKLNEVVMAALPKLLLVTNVIHQCGDYSVTNSYETIYQYYQKIRDVLPGKLLLRKFVESQFIGEVYARSSLVVCRGGAHTVSEMLALNKPALVVPIPWVSHNEQFKNANILKQEGLAEVIEEAELNEEIFVEKVKYMLHNIKTYQLKSAVNYSEMSKNSIDLITNEILAFSKKA